MKTVPLKINFLWLLLMVASLEHTDAAGFLSLDADARYSNTDFRQDDFTLKTLGIVARKVIPDEEGDRWILYSQVEIVDDFSQVDFHQMYAMLKGPMGKWNVSAGRLRLPYGLLLDYSTDHVPFAALDHYTLSIESDNGVAVSGSIGFMDYNVAVTQGAGIFSGFPQKGLLTGRLSIPWGVFGDFSCGISGAAGRSESSHQTQSVLKRMKLGAFDFSGSPGRLSLRTEISAGMQGDEVQAAGFAGADFTVTKRLEINSALSVVREDDQFHHAWVFGGITLFTPYLMIKGGYKYVYYGPIDHQITLMAYKQFSFNF